MTERSLQITYRKGRAFAAGRRTVDEWEGYFHYFFSWIAFLAIWSTSRGATIRSHRPTLARESVISSRSLFSIALAIRAAHRSAVMILSS